MLVGLVLGVGAGVGAGGVIFFVVGAAIETVGVGLGLWRRAELRARARLRDHGMVCEGLVLTVEQNLHVRVNRRHPWRVRYRYNAGGRDYEGTESIMDLPATVKPGGRVAVAYDMANPQHSALKDV